MRGAILDLQWAFLFGLKSEGPKGEAAQTFDSHESLALKVGQVKYDLISASYPQYEPESHKGVEFWRKNSKEEEATWAGVIVKWKIEQIAPVFRYQKASQILILMKQNVNNKCRHPSDEWNQWVSHNIGEVQAFRPKIEE